MVLSNVDECLSNVDEPKMFTVCLSVQIIRKLKPSRLCLQDNLQKPLVPGADMSGVAP